MTDLGVRSPNVAATSLLDTIIGNRKGSSRLQSMTDLAKQLAGTSPINLLGNQAPLFKTSTALAASALSTKISAWVYEDPTAANNGIWRWTGTVWEWALPLPYSFMEAEDVGAGTANAIKATSKIPVSEETLILVELFRATTGEPATISFNDGSPLTIKTNRGTDASALTAGMVIAGKISGTVFRLVTDEDVTTLVAQAESALTAANEAREAAEQAAANAATTLAGAVRFDDELSLTESQMEMARQNIEAASSLEGALAAQLPNLSAGNDPKALFRVSDDGKSLVPYYNRLQRYSIFDDGYCTKAEWSDVISGNPTLDLASNVQLAINYATQEKMIVHIPQVFPKLGQQITFDSRVNIECDDHAMMWFTNSASAGFKVTGYLAGNAPGYGHVRLPQGVGPGDISGYTGNAQTNSYSTSGFTGAYLTMEDCVWMKVEIMQGKGWGAGIEFTSNVFGCFNLDVKLGTLDLCKTPVLFTPKNGKPVGQSRIVADNLFGLFPLCFDVSGGGSIFEWDISALGMVVAEVGGSCVYTKGVTMSSPYTMTDVRVRSKAENRYSSQDSPSSVSQTYIGPLISGDQTAANGDTACTNGQRNRFELHLDDRVPSTSRAIKSKGPDIIEIVAPLESPVNPLTSILMSQTAGLANFNSGKMLLHKKNRLSLVTSGDLAANASTDFFFYHEATRNDLNMPMFSVVQRDNQNGLQVYIIPEGVTEAGRQRVRIRNESGATITSGAALNFHVNTNT
ncbi:hypothetical protein FS800_23465 [Agrobacterium vitis]|uniref:hypothetical protein n=1 Tax=Allorhizobium ampelinum TaxID=3025782 RepID=UPI001F3081DB|nr:hypothetical protein [Allorhizobium ampelinum]MCF1485092.1 hypothetical protein [Allorhizobium ampelinum]